MGRPTGRAWLDFGSTVPAASTLSLNTSNGRAQIRHRKLLGGCDVALKILRPGAFRGFVWIAPWPPPSYADQPMTAVVVNPRDGRWEV